MNTKEKMESQVWIDWEKAEEKKKQIEQVAKQEILIQCALNLNSISQELVNIFW